LTINLLGELPFQFRNSLFEHVPMDGRSGGGEIAPRLLSGQLDRTPSRRAFALGRQGRPRMRRLGGNSVLLKLGPSNSMLSEPLGPRLKKVCHQCASDVHGARHGRFSRSL
jgi:hypothetical protein